MRDKMINNKKKELLSRRSFFRKISQSVLPVVGAVIFSSLPVPSSAFVIESYDCRGNCEITCRGQCYYTCTGRCCNSCRETCILACRDSCNDSCKDGCATCSDVCRQDCQLDCNDSCSNNCRTTSVSIDSLTVK